MKLLFNSLNANRQDFKYDRIDMGSDFIDAYGDLFSMYQLAEKRRQTVAWKFYSIDLVAELQELRAPSNSPLSPKWPARLGLLLL